MSHIAEEIATEPACWLAAADRARAVGAQLPRTGERVAVVGCGTSYNVASSYAVLREGRGGGFTDAFPASEVRWRRAYDRVLLISRSGTTSEVLAVARSLPEGTPAVALTAEPRSPLAEAVEHTIVLDFAHERSVVQTRFATSVLALLRAHLGEDLAGAVADGRAALEAPLDEDWMRAQRFTFLGTGWVVGLAGEAALKLRESALCWTESYPAMELRHGPISVVDAGTLVWSLDRAPEGLGADVTATGAIFVDASLDPLAELVRIHRLALALAEARGLDPDHPRHLSFSVVLDD